MKCENWKLDMRCWTFNMSIVLYKAFNKKQLLVLFMKYETWNRGDKKILGVFRIINLK